MKSDTRTLDISHVRGILFDVDGTLYSQRPLRAVMMVLLLFRYFFKPRELVRKAKVINSYRKAQEMIRVSSEIVLNGRKKQLEITAQHTGESDDYVLEIVKEWFEKRPLPFLRFFKRKDMKNAIVFLYRKGFKLGTYSDYPVEDKLEALGVSKYLTTAVYSGDPMVRGFKPNTNGFHVAAKKMGLLPSEILYIGDRPDIDGIGASTAGMQAMIIRPFQMRRQRKEFPSFSSFKRLINIFALPN